MLPASRCGAETFGIRHRPAAPTGRCLPRGAGVVTDPAPHRVAPGRHVAPCPAGGWLVDTGGWSARHPGDGGARHGGRGALAPRVSSAGFSGAPSCWCCGRSRQPSGRSWRCWPSSPACYRAPSPWASTQAGSWADWSPRPGRTSTVAHATPWSLPVRRPNSPRWRRSSRRRRTTRSPTLCTGSRSACATRRSSGWWEQQASADCSRTAWCPSTSRWSAPSCWPQ